MANSLLVFLTCILLESFSNVISPVALSMTKTHSFVYGRCEPLNTVCGTPAPSKWGTVTVTSFDLATSTVAILLISTEAGLKSSESGECHAGNYRGKVNVTYSVVCGKLLIWDL